MPNLKMLTVFTLVGGLLLSPVLPQAKVRSESQDSATDVFRDDFEGSALDPGWEIYVPQLSPLDSNFPNVTLVEGKLTIAVDSHNNYDHWTDADRAP